MKVDGTFSACLRLGLIRHDTNSIVTAGTTGFRKRVLTAYGQSCAMCGIQLRTGR